MLDFIYLCSATYGVIIRDCSGSVIICRYGRSSAKDAFCAEGWAMLIGLKLAINLKMSHVQFEGDNDLLINMLAHRSGLAPIGLLGESFSLAGILRLSLRFAALLMFGEVSGNGAAHGLASLAKQILPLSCWTSFVLPDDLLYAVNYDLSKINE